MLVAGGHPVLSYLRHQLEHAVVTRREYTGAGLYVDFAVALDFQRSTLDSFVFGDVDLETPALESGIGTVLFVKEGGLSLLELYTYDESWPDDVGSYRLRYSSTPRDLAALDAVALDVKVVR